MYNFVVLSAYGQVAEVQLPAVPQIGEQIDMFYTPHPTITSIVWAPQEDILLLLGCPISASIAAIITVQ